VDAARARKGQPEVRGDVLITRAANNSDLNQRRQDGIEA
jgi:hypothetical protein